MNKMKQTHSSRSGSALLVTLLVVSLLLVMVLSLVAVVRMELRKVISHQEMLQARANARLGGELAIARLQETLGADTRVSATADLFRRDLAPAVNDRNLYQSDLTSQPGKRFWTGVWDSTSFDERDPQGKDFMGWLVSGSPVEVDAVGDPVDGGEMRPLVGPGSVAVPEDQVWVTPQDILVPDGGSGRRVGEFAFWVGDEGVKARFNLEDAHRGATTREQRQQRLQSAQRHAAEMIRVGGISLEEANLFPDTAAFRSSLDRLLIAEQLPFLGWDEASRDDFDVVRTRSFHDISLNSRGLFTNTRDGGLMRDLTLAFEMPLEDYLDHDFFGRGRDPSEWEPMPYWPSSTTAPPDVPVFRIEGDELRDALLGDFPEDGPTVGQNPLRTEAPLVRGATWLLLRNYYRLYKQNDADRAAFGFSAGSPDITELHRSIGGRRFYNGRSSWPNAQMYGLGRRYGQDVNAWRNAEDYGPDGTNYSIAFPLGRTILPGVAPVITRVQFVFSVRSYLIDRSDLPADAPNEDFYRIDLFIDPVISLMNPYDVPIRTGGPAGQNLDISVEFIDTIFRMELETPSHPDGRENWDGRDVRFATLAHDTSQAEGGNRYRAEYDEAFFLRLNVGDELRMEPGEVIVFAGNRSEPVLYRRTGDGRNEPSGINLDLEPGIQAFILQESGIRFPDAFRRILDWMTNPEQNHDIQRAKRRISAADPDDPDSVDEVVREFVEGDAIAFRMHALQHGRIRISGGITRHGISMDRLPFFESSEASMRFRTEFGPRIEVDDDLMFEQKLPFAIMDWYLKPSEYSHPFFLKDHHNLRALTYEQGTRGNFQTKLYSERMDDLLNVSGITTMNVDTLDEWIARDGDSPRGYWGTHNTNAGQLRVPLFSLPQAPLQSLGAFQSLMLQPMGDDPGMIFGNSRAPLFGVPGQKIALQEMESDNFDGGKEQGASNRRPATRGQADMTRPDWSYLYNEALWDGFFFSTVTSEAQFEDFLDGEALPNGLIRPWQDSADTATLFEAGIPRTDAPERAAAQLTREGAFNVNSTSVEAWRALLSSTRNLSMDVQGSATPIQIDGTVFSRSLLPEDAENEVWTGFRNLTDVQINTLAENIVREIRVRGPFLNLADFVNRRLAPANHPSQRSGAVQAAIDETLLNSNGFNRTLRTAGRTNLNNYSEWMQDKIGDHLDHPILANLSGYLTQADVLTVIGPLLSARSDTFTVRAFGEHAGARVWCEITVQRVPDYVEDSVEAWVRPEASGPVNQRFGRRFVITSFRWLGEEDV
jgi:hypothetical protein